MPTDYHSKTAALAALSLFLATSAFAENRVALADLQPEDRTYINRGHSLAEGSCINNVINEIDSYGGADAMREFTINLDGGNPTSIESRAAGIVHTCTGGEHVMRDSTGTMLLQVYDDNGEPTLMEP